MKETTPIRLGSESRWVLVSERLPEPGKFVRYRTEKFTYAGTVDRSGQWMDNRGRPEIAEVVAWMEI